MFDYNPAGLFLGIVPLIIVFYFLLKFTSNNKNYYYYMLLLTLTYVGGTISLVTTIPYDFLRSFVELLIWIQFILLVVKNKRINKIGLITLLFFILAICLSSIIARVSFVSILLFVRRYLFLPLAFFSISLSKIDKTNSIRLFKLIISLSIVQIFVAIQKLFTIGQEEDYIGSLAIYGGSLTTIFALICFGFSYSYFIIKKDLKSILLMFGFILFAISGEKRGFIVYLPLYVLFIHYLHSKYIKLKFTFKPIKTVLVIFVFLASFYTFVKFQPSLNPDGEFGGNFDISYLSEYVTRFFVTDDIETVDGSFSRLLVYLQVYNIIENNIFGFNPWFGFGPGDLIMSRFSEFYGIYVSEEDLMSNKYGIGYGGRSGFIFTFLQIGIIGTLFYFLYIKSIFHNWLALFKRNIMNEYNYLYMGLYSTIFVFWIDFFTYSRSFQDKISIFIPLILLGKILHINSKKLPG